MSDMETTTATTTSTGGNSGNRNDRNGPYVSPKNREVTPRDGGGSMARIEDMFPKMIRKFDASDEHNNELRVAIMKNALECGVERTKRDKKQK